MLKKELEGRLKHAREENKKLLLEFRKIQRAINTVARDTCDASTEHIKNVVNSSEYLSSPKLLHIVQLEIELPFDFVEQKQNEILVQEINKDISGFTISNLELL